VIIDLWEEVREEKGEKHLRKAWRTHVNFTMVSIPM
jgi:hypothetical protein